MKTEQILTDGMITDEKFKRLEDGIEDGIEITFHDGAEFARDFYENERNMDKKKYYRHLLDYIFLWVETYPEEWELFLIEEKELCDKLLEKLKAYVEK